MIFLLFLQTVREAEGRAGAIVCDKCGKTIVGDKNTLRRHANTVHRSDKPFPCTAGCEARFKRKDAVGTHIKSGACQRKLDKKVPNAAVVGAVNGPAMGVITPESSPPFSQTAVGRPEEEAATAFLQSLAPPPTDFLSPVQMPASCDEISLIHFFGQVDSHRLLENISIDDLFSKSGQADTHVAVGPVAGSRVRGHHVSATGFHSSAGHYLGEEAAENGQIVPMPPSHHQMMYGMNHEPSVTGNSLMVPAAAAGHLQGNGHAGDGWSGQQQSYPANHHGHGYYTNHCRQGVETWWHTRQPTYNRMWLTGGHNHPANPDCYGNSNGNIPSQVHFHQVSTLQHQTNQMFQA